MHIAFVVGYFVNLLCWHHSELRAQDFPFGYEKNLLERTFNEIQLEAQDSLEYLGRWGWGWCWGVAAMGNYVFTGSGPTLLWLDVTNKGRPVVAWDTLNNTSVIESYTDVRGFAIQDSIGYAIMRNKLVVVDFRNPVAPAIIGELYLDSGALTLVVEGTLVFVVRYYGGLYVVDVSNPSSPYLRTIVNEPAQWPNLTITNHNLYIVDANDLQTYYANVSNPDSISVTPMYLQPFIRAGYARDSLLVLVNGRFHVYSIAVPASPVLLSSVLIPDVSTISVTLKGDTAFVGDRFGKIVAIDISNRYNPVVIGTYVPPVLQTEVGPGVLAVEDTALYSVNGIGMTTYSIADPSSISVLSFFPTGHENNKVIVRDGLAYVTSGLAGLWIVDVSDPSYPRRVGNIQTAGYAYDVVVDSTTAYLSLNHPWRLISEEPWNGIWTLDVNRPDSIRFLDSCTINSPFAISKSGSLLFVTQGNNVFPPSPPYLDTTLTLLDVIDPSDIRHMSSITAGLAREITSGDSIAFVANESGFGYPNPGLNIYDCRNPADPQLLSTIFSRALGVSLSGHRVYVHRTDSFFVVDITDLTAPTILGRIRRLPPYSGPFESVLTRNLVFWADNSGKFGALDVSNPNQPRNLFQDARADYGGGIDVVGDIIYVTDYYEGLRIFRYKSGTTSVEGSEQPIVGTMYLFPNYPNPFNPTTSIRFEVPVSGFVSLKVYNLLGQEVATLVKGELKAGSYATVFDAPDLPSGVYFYRLTTSEKNITRKMVILR